ncbi:uncharacterized protein LOC119966955 [Scyliorhinus canicula]|uniref:uncharacterized protein LOC119966955 n=1 Tax=Scyliorhinus canicula TaxID=7830 RepID=UPI0018F54CF3|nr:uncharacterized protein LOC119966955 [Scyliorhinus canicula]
MLRIFLTVSVLFWNHLAAQNLVGKVIELCDENDCQKPSIFVEDKNYDEVQFKERKRVETEVDAEDIESALAIGLEKLFSYARCGNVAGTIVPLSAPWGVIGYLKNGEIQQKFRVFLVIVPQVTNPPAPTDPTVEIVTAPPVWYYGRAFDTKVDKKQMEERLFQIMKDLEQDNQSFDSTYFIMDIFNTDGLTGMGFEKTGE